MSNKHKQIDSICVKRLQAHDFAETKTSAMKRAATGIAIILLMALILIHCVPAGA